MDLSKASDCIPHGIGIAELVSYGFVEKVSQHLLILRGCLYEVRWAGWLARLVYLGDIIFIPRSYGTFLSHFNQKVCYIAGKKLFSSRSF